MTFDPNNLTQATTTGIVMQENPVVLAWVTGTLVFIMLLAASVFIGLCLYLKFGNQSKGGAI